MGDSPKWVKSRRRRKQTKKERKLVITMAKLRMAHASTHGTRKPPGPIDCLSLTINEVLLLLVNSIFINMELSRQLVWKLFLIGILTLNNILLVYKYSIRNYVCTSHMAYLHMYKGEIILAQNTFKISLTPSNH